MTGFRVPRISRSGIVKSVASASAALGAASAVGVTFQHVIFGVLTFLAIVAGCPFYFARSERDQFGSDADNALDACKIQIGATPVTIAQSRKIAKNTFGNDIIPDDAIGGLFAREPRSLVTLLCNGAPVGYSDYYLLTRATAEKMLAGEIDERQLSDAVVMDFARWLAQEGDRYIYFAGVVVEGSPYQRGVRLMQLMWGVLHTVLRCVERDDRGGSMIAFASAYSSQGRKLLSRLGFGSTGVETPLGALFVRSADVSTLKQSLAGMPDFTLSTEWMRTTGASREPTVAPKSNAA